MRQRTVWCLGSELIGNELWLAPTHDVVIDGIIAKLSNSTLDASDPLTARLTSATIVADEMQIRLHDASGLDLEELDADLRQRLSQSRTEFERDGVPRPSESVALVLVKPLTGSFVVPEGVVFVFDPRTAKTLLTGLESSGWLTFGEL